MFHLDFLLLHNFTHPENSVITGSICKKLDMQSNLTKRTIHSFLYHTITSFNKPV